MMYYEWGSEGHGVDACGSQGLHPWRIFSGGERLETSTIQEDRSQPGLQLGAACAVPNCAWQKIYLHAPHLQTFAPHCVFGPLDLLGAAWQPRTCGPLFPGGWKEIVSRPPKLSWRKLLTHSDFISLDLLDLHRSWASS